MRTSLSTVEAAFVLNLRPGTLARAVWDGRVGAPAKGPGGAYHWSRDDLVRASWRLYGHNLSDAARCRLEEIGGAKRNATQDGKSDAFYQSGRSASDPEL